MTRRQIEHAQFVCERLGLSLADYLTLSRAEKSLRRWYEKECGDSSDNRSWAIERDGATEVPYMVVHIYPKDQPTITRRYRVRDMERAAIRKIEAVLAGYPELTYYVAGDPRYGVLWVIRRADLSEDANLYVEYGRGFAI